MYNRKTSGTTWSKVASVNGVNTSGMSDISGVPGIVTDSLVFNVDVGDPDSYSGAGTLNDLSSTVSGTLENSPVYSSGNGGYLTLDATDDYIAFGSVSATQFDTVDPFSVSFWIDLSWTSTQSFPIIIGNKQSTSPYYGWEIFGPTGDRRKLNFSIWPAYSSQRLEVSLDSPIATNQWVNACVTYDGSKSAVGVSWYVNGSAVSTSTIYNSASNNTISYASAAMNIGNRGSLGGGFFQDSDIATCSIYSKELSSSEVLQNYNATKSRFGY